MAVAFANNRESVGERELDIELALGRFVSPVDSIAQEGFDRLRCLCDGYAYSVLRSFPTHDQDDAVQNAWLKIWEARSRFKAQGLHSWLKYLKITVLRCAFDKRSGKDFPLDERGPSIDDLWEALCEAVSTNTIQMKIGEAWCRYSRDLSDVERAKRVWAVKSLLIDRKSLTDVRRTLFPNAPTAKANSTLEEWLQEAPVIRDLAFHILDWNCRKLTANVLGVSVKEMIRLQRVFAGAGQEAAPTWTPQETQAIIHRFFFCKTAEEISKELNFDFSTISDRCKSKMPFAQRTKQLKSILGDKASVLAEIHLWKRLAFVQGYRDNVKQKDILFRLQDAAGVGGYESFTASNLNVWFGNRRLIQEILRQFEDSEINL